MKERESNQMIKSNIDGKRNDGEKVVKDWYGVTYECLKTLAGWITTEEAVFS